jgi:serine/threonine-protein kinase
MREVLVGDELDQFTLDDLLARSGMASIFKATDRETGETVALKIPHMHLESDVVFYERFKREEKIGQRLDHPGIIRVRTPHAKSRMYIAMEFVDGRSLRAVLSEEKRLPTERALGITRQLAEAVAYLHAQGVVHRDLKPENVLVSGDGKVKILDFGIALDESARRLTWFKLSTAMGTPDYMAPEQIGGRRGDVRTDVYALGTILFELLTGHLPYSAPNPHALVRAKTSDEPRAPSYFLPNLDPGVEAVVMKAIERAPRDRYQTMAEMIADLAEPARALEASGPAIRPQTRRRALSSARLRTALAILGVLGALAALVWVSGRHAGAGRGSKPTPPQQVQEAQQPQGPQEGPRRR